MLRMGSGVGLGAALVAYHNALILLVPRVLHLPLNLAMAGATVAWARRRRLSWERIGLGRSGVRPGLRWGLAIAAAGAAGLALLLALGGEGLVRDRRFAGLRAPGVLFRILVRIPLGTALAEEVAFRGVLFGNLDRERSTAVAVAGSSLAFGLWHVAPTLSMLEANRPGLGPADTTLAVAGAVVATTAGGVLFALLRIRSRGILGPVLAHWGFNVLGTLGAVYAERSET